MFECLGRIGYSLLFIFSGYQLWHHPTVDNLLQPPVKEDSKGEGQEPIKGKSTNNNSIAVILSSEN